MFTQIIEPLGHKARERNKEFMELYAQIITKFTCNFAEKFCDDGKIDWERLVKFNADGISTTGGKTVGHLVVIDQLPP